MHAIHQAIRIHRQSVIRVIRQTMVTLMILIMLQSVFLQPVINVIQPLPGRRRHGIMTVNIFRFIQAGTMEDGIPVQIVIQIRVIMHRIPVMLFAIKVIITRTRIAIHAIREVMHEEK